MQWRIMVATGAVMPIVMLYLSQYVLLESPRWLVAQGEIPEAHVILSKLNPNSSGEFIMSIIFVMKRMDIILIFLYYFFCHKRKRL